MKGTQVIRSVTACSMLGLEHCDWAIDCRMTSTRSSRKERQTVRGCYLRDCPCRSQCRRHPSSQRRTSEMRWPLTEPLPSSRREYSCPKCLCEWNAACWCLLLHCAQYLVTLGGAEIYGLDFLFTIMGGTRDCQEYQSEFVWNCENKLVCCLMFWTHGTDMDRSENAVLTGLSIASAS
jgi:hypothetical protein